MSYKRFWGSLELHLSYNLATSVGLTFRHKLVGECENNFGFGVRSRNRDSLAIEIIFNILATFGFRGGFWPPVFPFSSQLT